MTIRVAAAQYGIEFLGNWRHFQEKIENWTEIAVRENAQILLFPEYASMELASIFGHDVYSSLGKQLEAVQTILDDYLDLYRNIAKNHGIYIVAGSFPVKTENGGFRNRAYFFYPDGRFDFQEKLQMTRFENEHWFIEAGDTIKLFDTEFGKIGINICYDSEFPSISRIQAEAGAKLILSPSCTDTLAGYYRVRIGCQARALENQCYVVQSPTVGIAEWSESIDINVGAAGFFTPVDKGFPDNGILKTGDLNQSQWLFADLDLDMIDEVRKNGQTLNYRDWPKQFNSRMENR